MKVRARCTSVACALAALALAGPAGAHLDGTGPLLRTSAPPPARVQLRLADRAIWHGRTTLAFLRRHPEAGTVRSRALVRRGHLWLLRFGRQQRARALARLAPAPPRPAGNVGMWARLVYRCESRGQPDPWYTNTGNGFFFGPQFTPGTWHSAGGGPVREMGDAGGRPMRSYSVAYIVAVANRALASQGPGAWPTCHRAGYI